MDSLEDHGPLAGLEGWRRLYAEQRGTIAQRADILRDKVINPERVGLNDVLAGITAWEKCYAELLDVSNGNFKLDEKGKIGALKRLLPQEVTSSLSLVSASMKSYKDARAFALEQVVECKNQQNRKRFAWACQQFSTQQC